MKKMNKFILFIICLFFGISYFSFVVVVSLLSIQVKLTIFDLPKLLPYLLTNIMKPFHVWNLFSYSTEVRRVVPITFLMTMFLFLISIGIIMSKFKGAYHLNEKGSAKWGEMKDRLKYFLNIAFEEGKINNNSKNTEVVNNMILSSTEYLPINDRKIHRNLNVCIFGGSGSGKTRYYVKPNIAQANCSMVITDPKGELLRETSQLLKEKGYEIKQLNLVNPGQSNKYNPFKYIKDDKDVSILVETLIKNTKDKDKKGGDQFWDDSAKALLKALVYYVHKEYPSEERNLNSVFKLLLKGREVEETNILDESKLNLESYLTYTIENLENEHPAKLFYSIFLQAPKETRMSILISLSVKLSFLGDKAISDMLEEDDINIFNCNQKRAVFVVIPDSTSAFNVVASIFFSQMFQGLYFMADNEYKGRLPIHHQFYMDEFANIGQVEGFSEKIATCRGRRIGVSIILQAKAQLEHLYDKNSDTIIGNCDTTLYLGGNDLKTAEEISKKLGKTTIDVKRKSNSRTFGKNPGGSENNNVNVHGRELLTIDELLNLEDKECIVKIRGINPFKSEKFEITKHPEYEKFEIAN